ncbi:unnamed protein product [Prunus armeniaca]|uniref:Uncharacterized protein n=1 Tax=Prunus armeniaca TaxID=36596 RepID=A0A6J5TGC7_PRUAR|nr:unnamed protein product [Prunus armeniaca]
MGLAYHIAKIHSEASVEHNGWELKQYIEELYWGSGKHVMLLGAQRGRRSALSIYWCDLKDKVAGLALVQSPYGGTPLASDILLEGQIADKENRRIMELLICKLMKIISPIPELVESPLCIYSILNKWRITSCIWKHPNSYLHCIVTFGHWRILLTRSKRTSS